MRSLFVLITVCVVLVFVWALIVEPGTLSGSVVFLTGDMSEVGKAHLMVFLFGNGVTALFMVTAEICAYVKRPASTNIQPVCSAGFIVNPIPFFTLNSVIVLLMVVQVVATVFFEFSSPPWLNISAVITTIFVTNEEARAHVATRLRQQIDIFTIGGNDTVHPVVSVATQIRQQTASFTMGGNNTVHPDVSIALVPLRSLPGSAPTLPTSTPATLCPVEAFECREKGGVDNYGCKLEDIELFDDDSEEDEDEKEEKVTVDIHNYGCKVEDIELFVDDSEEDEDVKEEEDIVERRVDSEEEGEEEEKRMDEWEKDESGDKEREENAEEVMDQRLKKHISQVHNYAQDLKVEDNGRESESVVVDMNMVKAEALMVMEAVDSEKKRRKQRLAWQ